MNTKKIIILTVIIYICFLVTGTLVMSPDLHAERSALFENIADDVEVTAASDNPGLIVDGSSEHLYIGEFSAYNPFAEQTDDTPMIMASGKEVYYGAVACPSTYDFGTMIEIENYGVFTCEDRMARRFREKNYFDILMFDRKKAIRFGRRTLRYKVVGDETPFVKIAFK